LKSERRDEKMDKEWKYLSAIINWKMGKEPRSFSKFLSTRGIGPGEIIILRSSPFKKGDAMDPIVIDALVYLPRAAYLPEENVFSCP
jgi:hypothetical protein